MLSELSGPALWQSYCLVGPLRWNEELYDQNAPLASLPTETTNITPSPIGSSSAISQVGVYVDTDYHIPRGAEAKNIIYIDIHAVVRLSNKHVRAYPCMYWYVKISCKFTGSVSTVFQCLAVPVTFELL